MSDAPSASEHPYHHGNLRAALLDASLDVLRQEGLGALTVRGVARRVGVSHTAAYRHFTDKTALLAAIAEQGFARLRNEMAAARATVAGAELQFVACGVAYVRFAMANADHFRVMFGGWNQDRSAHPQLRAAADGAFEVLLGLVQAGQASGVLRRDDPQVMALAAWASVHGLATLLLEQQLTAPAHTPLDGERLAHRCALLLLNGVRHEPADEPRGA